MKAEEELANVWRANLNMIADTYDMRRDLAVACDSRPEYFYQLLSGSRRLGNRAVRGFEKKLNLPLYWLDAEHTPQEVEAIFGEKKTQTQNASSVDYVLLRKCAESAYRAALRQDIQDPELFGHVLVQLFKQRSESGGNGDGQTSDSELLIISV